MLPTDDLEIRREEWRRWCLSGERHRGRAASAEGSYRSPQHWEAVTWAPAAPPVVHRAHEVERVVVALANPLRVVMTLFYIKGAPMPVLHRILRCRFRIAAALVLG